VASAAAAGVGVALTAPRADSSTCRMASLQHQNHAKNDKKNHEQQLRVTRKEKYKKAKNDERKKIIASN
jgi:hypothetical protein